MSTRINILVSVWLLLLLASCRGDSKRRAYEEAIMEWTGKEIVFPDSMRLVGGGMISLPESDFTIVSYYDSVGCTGCRLKLPLWQEFMRRVDSVRGDRTVTLVLIVASRNERELKLLKGDSDFRHIFIVDPDDRVNRINDFPKDNMLRTFLLDGSKRVVTFGNPNTKLAIRDLYLSIMSESPEGYIPEDEAPTYSHDFGRIESGDTVRHRFLLWNSSPDTLKVRDLSTSCECTDASISRTIIPPDSTYYVTVSFSDTIDGTFLRSATLFFENKNTVPLRIEVSGMVSNKTKQ